MLIMLQKNQMVWRQLWLSDCADKCLSDLAMLLTSFKHGIGLKTDVTGPLLIDCVGQIWLHSVDLNLGAVNTQGFVWKFFMRYI